MAAVTRRYPAGEDVRTHVETVLPDGVVVHETGYGYSCHVGRADGGSFLAIDADRSHPQVYFDPASARGREAVASAQPRHAVNYVLEAVVAAPQAAAAHVRRHADRLARRRRRAEDDPSVPTVLPTGGVPRAPDGEALVGNFRDAMHHRGQYLHGCDLDRTTEKALSAYRRDPLTNDKLGRQFGWRMGVRRVDTGPDLALEFVAAASYNQVAEALVD